MRNDENRRDKDEKITKRYVSEAIGKIIAMPSKMLGEILRNCIMLIIVGGLIILMVCRIGIPFFGTLFQNLSPWSEQRQDIINKNNVRDAYSAIIGSDVGVVSQNGIIKFFSSKEAKEIDISIPKLINYSPLFDDDSRREELKDAFENSINKDMISQSTKYCQILYDGSTIAKWKNGKKVSDYKNLGESDKKEIVSDLHKKLRMEKDIEFKEWQNKNGIESVEYEFISNTNTVKIKGICECDGILWFTPEYKISVQYKYSQNEWKMIKGSLKAKEIK